MVKKLDIRECAVGSSEHRRVLKVYKELLKEEEWDEETTERVERIIQKEQMILDQLDSGQKEMDYD